MTNKREFRVLAMRRSGHHAILDWIIAQLAPDTKWCHLNDVKINDENPLETDLGDNFRGTRDPDRDMLIYNIEDTEVETFLTSRLATHHDEWLGESQEVCNLLIMRDVFNLHASRYAMMQKGEMFARFRPEIFKNHAREFLRETSLFGEPFIPISYNQWAVSPRYRKHLAAQLGLTFSDKGRQSVAHLGSSFDGIKFQGNAKRMKVNERWRRYVDHPDYLASLDDSELIGLSCRVFGYVKGTDSLSWCAAPTRKGWRDR